MKTLTDIIEQLELCKFECEAGPLEMNRAFIELKGRVIAIQMSINMYDMYDLDIFERSSINIISRQRSSYFSMLRYLWQGVDYDT